MSQSFEALPPLGNDKVNFQNLSNPGYMGNFLVKFLTPRFADTLFTIFKIAIFKLPNGYLQIRLKNIN